MWLALGVITYILFTVAFCVVFLGAGAMAFLDAVHQSNAVGALVGLGVFAAGVGLMVHLWRWFDHGRRTGDWTLPDTAD